MSVTKTRQTRSLTYLSRPERTRASTTGAGGPVDDGAVRDNIWVDNAVSWVEQSCMEAAMLRSRPHP